jgi:hypothetical protein
MSVLREQRNGSSAEESLCLTCTNGQVIWGFSETQVRTLCYWGYPITAVPFPVRKCTGYKDRRRADLDDMKEVAHVLVRGQRGKQVGFVTPDQYRDLQEECELEECNPQGAALLRKENNR